MTTAVVYLNDLCLLPGESLQAARLLRAVLQVIKVLQRAKQIRRDFAVDGATTLLQAKFGIEAHSLSSILQGDDYREEWRFLKNLEQMSPYGARDAAHPLPATLDVRYRGQTAIAMSWARANSTAVLSFPLGDDWTDAFISATLQELDDTSAVQECDIEVPNLAGPDHVEIHRELILNYGNELSHSSVVYEGDGFVVRIYFNDHNPPHFHVMESGNTARTIARLSISNLEPLEAQKSMSSTLRRRVIAWAEPQKEALMNCWNACMEHRSPARLRDN